MDPYRPPPPPPPLHFPQQQHQGGYPSMPPIPGPLHHPPQHGLPHAKPPHPPPGYGGYQPPMMPPFSPIHGPNHHRQPPPPVPPHIVPPGYPASPAYPRSQHRTAPPPSQSFSPPQQDQQQRRSSSVTLEKHTTLFIGNLPPAISEEWITALLEICGRIKSWKRLRDANSGEHKRFGFCEYEETEAVLRAMRLLGGGGDEDKGLEIVNFKGEASKLKVRADEKTRNYLEDYKQRHPLTSDDEAKDNECIEKITKLIDELRPAAEAPTKDLREGTEDADRKGDRSWRKRRHHGHSMSRSRSPSAPSLSSPSQTSVSRSRRKERSSSLSRHKRRSPEAAADVENSDIDANQSERWEGMSLTLSEEEEWEKEQRQNHIYEMEERYRERERCWMDLEKDRIEQIQRLDLRELVEMENRVKDQDIMAKRLAEWDDKREEARGRELYYRNREKWWRQRRAERARELKRDEEDLQEEEAEKRVSTVEATTDATTTTTTTTEPEGEDKLPSQQQQPWQGENDVKAGEELEPIAKEAKVPKPALPESRDDLFGWPVKWNNLSDQVLSNKIRPVAEHWLRQHFGDATEEEDLNDLVQSVTEHLQAHKSAQGLVDDLDMLLDESTGTFVELVWRTLVSETESFAEDSTPS